MLYDLLQALMVSRYRDVYVYGQWRMYLCRVAVSHIALHSYGERLYTLLLQKIEVVSSDLDQESWS